MPALLSAVPGLAVPGLMIPGNPSDTVPPPPSPAVSIAFAFSAPRLTWAAGPPQLA